MRKLLVCLLTAALLFSLAITASADTAAGKPGEAPGSETPGQAEVIPNEAELPDGYEINPDFFMTFTLDAENGWSYSLKDLLGEADSDEYIYFIVEEDVADGYIATYALDGADFSENSPLVPTGNVVIVRNIKDGEAPVYELPESGAGGTMPYTVTAVLRFFWPPQYMA